MSPDLQNAAPSAREWRDRILSQPELVLEDADVMRALLKAGDTQRGSNVVDLRGLAMDRLETELDALQDTHRHVIAAAYENVAGTAQIHRAILQLLDPPSFPALLMTLEHDLRNTLRVDTVRLVLETVEDEPDPALDKFDGVLCTVPGGFIADYAGREGPVVLRPAAGGVETIYGDRTKWIGSEALLRLDLGPGRLPGMLALGAGPADQFTPAQGTDLLGFFTGVFQRIMRRWLS
ncbi:DUF484 family protein [Falsirhodobacter halotolerans]|uniref:DUF484 family protein n=1 Tax=Falsirhodobacter halotolerans TaxID=1146892 RepID=UPI001FD361AA|nr:DUF484 family protein [Falsirhodobacter halotolerans]MCJ8138851.1 DUF484 family protein [Falsirhodobacter halotolerans]